MHPEQGLNHTTPAVQVFIKTISYIISAVSGQAENVLTQGQRK
jgi:hypothetical protein